MSRLSPIALVLLVLFLSGCETATSPDPRLIGPPATIDLSSCGGNDLWPLIGQDVGLLPETGGWGALRVLWPDSAMTEDYSESRLNVMVDRSGIIQSLNCG